MAARTTIGVVAAVLAVVPAAVACSPTGESTSTTVPAVTTVPTEGTVASTASPDSVAPTPVTTPAQTLPAATVPAGGSLESPQTRWAAHLRGPTNEDEIDGVAAAPDGSLYVTGKFELTATLGGAELVSAGRADIPLARFDADGTPL